MKPLELANPISADMAAMRASLWPGLVKALQYNLNRQQSRVRLFEAGLRFVGQLPALEQEAMLAGVVTGSREPEGWRTPAKRWISSTSRLMSKRCSHSLGTAAPIDSFP